PRRAVGQMLEPDVTARVDLAPADASRLEALTADPDQTGALVYRGAVYDANGHDAAPVLRYERRVAERRVETDTELVSSHLTFVRDQVVIVQRAVSSAAYALQQFSEVNQQTGVLSQVAVDAQGGLVFTQTRDGEVETSTEGSGPPVVVGPTLFGFVLSQWDALNAGQSVRVRFAAVDRMQSYEFDLRLHKSDSKRSVVSFTATRFFVRLAMDTMYLTFDTQTRHIVRYEGLVPPQLEVEGDLEPLRARVEYTFSTPRYR
ncbi:MAG: hypothetical protein ACI9U2_002075, partial [Bradymonadia bacterium]